MLRDFTKAFIKAERQNVLAMLRTRVINEIARKDAWVVTYTNNATFSCLFLAVADPACGTGDTRFVVYNNESKVVLDATASSYLKGFTKTGVECNAYPSLDCPIRLEVRWALRNLGDNPDMITGNISFVPTNIMPSGYYPKSFLPNWNVGDGGSYNFFGATSAQVEVTGTFAVYSGVAFGTTQADNLANQYQPGKYGFKLLKEVP